jgi:PQQ-dependent dehydrogenase (methanol/ethanol family)
MAEPVLNFPRGAQVGERPPRRVQQKRKEADMSNGCGRAFAVCAAMAVMALSPGKAAEMNPHPDKPVPLPPASDWSTYNGPYSGQRFSELKEINDGSVADLKEMCRVRVGESGPFQAGPVIQDNTLFLTTPHATLAVNPSNCEILWKSIYTPQGPEPWTANRGVAFWQGKVIRGTPDARLVAYDAATGRELWQTIVGDGGLGELIDSAPIAWNGLVFAGLSGGDFGIRGRMFAFSAVSGKPVWQFNLIPQAGEPGSESWAGGTYERGGGGTWTSYALDPESGEVFVPVANPAPSFNRSSRKGANLYADSLVVLDAYTGKLKWFFQVRPSDDHDYGVTSPPMIFTLRDGRKVVALGSKDGHVYVIDRAKHTLIYKTAVVPLKNFLTQPTPEGIEICPGVLGGIEWNGPALDRLNDALVVGADDWCSTLKSEPQDYKAGTLFTQGRAGMLGDAKGVISSLDAASGKIRWAFHTPNGVVSAVTPTAGGLVFAGDLSGNLYALRSANGEVLKKIETGGAMAGGIITYTVADRQYLAVTSGNVSRATFGEVGVPTLIVYGLGGTARTAAAGVAPADASSGGTGYAQLCGSCHGPHGEGGAAAKLEGIGARLDDAAVAALIKKPPSPRMPALYPSVLTEADVASLAAFVRSLK